MSLTLDADSVTAATARVATASGRHAVANRRKRGTYDPAGIANHASELNAAVIARAIITSLDKRPNLTLVACVTNMDMDTNSLRGPTAFETFTAQIPPGQQAGLHVAGANLNEGQARLFHRYVRRRLKQGDGVNPPIRLMVEIQRDVAKTDRRKTVGFDALCVHIPRTTGMPYGAMSNLGGVDLPTGSTSFGFMDRRGWQWEQEAPLSASGGFVKKFWGSADPDHPDNQTVSMQMLKVPKSWQGPQTPS